MRRPDIIATLGVAFVGVVWGTFWIPTRALSDIGVRGPWGTAAVYVAMLVALAPILALRGGRFHLDRRAVVLAGLCCGISTTLYMGAFSFTTVVRAQLLFYLTAVWSALMERLLFKVRLDGLRALALACGLGGLLVILGAGQALPLPRNIGDWMALLGGVAWAYGSLCLWSAERSDIVSYALVYVVSGLAFILIVAITPIGMSTAPPSVSALGAGTMLIAFMAWVIFLPSIFTVHWCAAQISPTRIGLLLLGEIPIGVISATLLTDEPFGTREAIGTALILSAALFETLRGTPKSTVHP